MVAYEILPPSYLDVNDDGFATAIDALLVINFINVSAAQRGEGESIHAPQSFADQDDLRSTIESDMVIRPATDALLASETLTGTRKRK
jgi:hypothetical protein